MGTPRTPGKTSISEKELRDAYEDFRELGIELKASTRSTRKFRRSASRNLAIFMYSSNGNDQLELMR